MAADDDQTGLDLDGAAFRPPMLEDAGLEDCALPVESIMEAFARAAALAVAEDGKGGGEEPDDDFDSEGSKKIALADEGSEEKGSSASETVVLGRNGSQEEISPPSPSKVAREEED